MNWLLSLLNFDQLQWYSQPSPSGRDR